MTAKEKAQVISAKFACLRLGEDFNKWGINICTSEVDKQCAIIAVEEILLEVNSLGEEFTLRLDGTRQYWEEVKNEIEKL